MIIHSKAFVPQLIDLDPILKVMKTILIATLRKQRPIKLYPDVSSNVFMPIVLLTY